MTGKVMWGAQYILHFLKKVTGASYFFPFPLHLPSSPTVDSSIKARTSPSLPSLIPKKVDWEKRGRVTKEREGGGPGRGMKGVKKGHKSKKKSVILVLIYCFIFSKISN